MCFRSLQMPGRPRVSPGNGAPATSRADTGAAASTSGRSTELFREELLQLRWANLGRRAGAGLVNQGNTCFLNSVLQCLTHTPPLAELALSGRKLGGEMVGVMQQHILRAFQGAGSSFSPTSMVQSLRVVNKRCVRCARPVSCRVLAAVDCINCDDNA